MIALCTGKPRAIIVGDTIQLSIPSGKGQVEVSFTLNQALTLRHSLICSTNEALGSDFAAPVPDAELIVFEKREA